MRLADGHAEIHNWRDKATSEPVTKQLIKATARRECSERHPVVSGTIHRADPVT